MCGFGLQMWEKGGKNRSVGRCSVFDSKCLSSNALLPGKVQGCCACVKMGSVKNPTGDFTQRCWKSAPECGRLSVYHRSEWLITHFLDYELVHEAAYQPYLLRTDK